MAYLTGSAGASQSEGAWSLFQNPAGLARLRTTEFLFQHVQWAGDIGYELAGLGVRRNRLGIGLGVQYFSMPEIDVIRGGIDTGSTVSVYDAAFTVGAGADRTDSISLGLAGRAVYSSLGETRGTCANIDMGGQWRFTPDAIAAAVIPYIGTDLYYNNGVSPVHPVANAGVTWRFHPSLTGSLGYELALPREHALSAGLEGDFSDFFVRAGSRYVSDALELYFGAGMALMSRRHRITLNYAANPTGAVGMSHWLSLGLARRE